MLLCVSNDWIRSPSWLLCFIQPEKASPSKNTPFSYNLPRVNEKLSPSPAQVQCVYPSIQTYFYYVHCSLQLIRTMVTNYCREAQNKIHFNMYSIEVSYCEVTLSYSTCAQGD